MNKVLVHKQQAEATRLSHQGSATVMQPSAGEIQQWLTVYLANLLELPYEDVDPTIAFANYGLDSAAAVGMTGELETWLGQDVDPTLPYIYTTIEALAQHLASGVDIKSYGEVA